jgi:hypothetical protein
MENLTIWGNLCSVIIYVAEPEPQKQKMKKHNYRHLFNILDIFFSFTLLLCGSATLVIKISQFSVGSSMAVMSVSIRDIQIGKINYYWYRYRYTVWTSLESLGQFFIDFSHK